MANYVTNVVSFEGDAQQIADLIAFVKSDSSLFDIGKIYGDVHKYAYNTTLESNVFRFETKWSTPKEAFLILSSQFPTVIITVQYADEDIGMNCGIFKFQARECIFSDKLDRLTFSERQLWALDLKQSTEEFCDYYLSNTSFLEGHSNPLSFESLPNEDKEVLMWAHARGYSKNTYHPLALLHLKQMAERDAES